MGGTMPEKATIARARRDKREGKSPSTQAGEFVRQEMHHVREGKHGARATKQASAIGLSEARRGGVKVPRETRISRGVEAASSELRRNEARPEAALEASLDCRQARSPAR